MDFSTVLNWDQTTYSGELIVSFIVMGIIAILAIVIGIVFKRQDPTKPDKGFVLVIETLVEKAEAFVVENMGRKWKPFTGYVCCLAMYILFSFLIGITGLPGPLTSLTCPLSIALITFVMIHATAIKANKWRYFKRYVEPMCFFLPINLLSMWAPLLSLSLRLFGNALAGYCIMTILYFYLGQLSTLIFSFLPAGVSSIWIAPIVTPVLHAYFDIFSGAIQTLVFVILTMIWVSQEDPDDEEEDQISLKTATN